MFGFSGNQTQHPKKKRCTSLPILRRLPHASPSLLLWWWWVWHLHKVVQESFVREG